MGDKERLALLKAQPGQTKQHGGCCGFAGTIMGLLANRPKEVDAIYNTVACAAPYRGIKEAGSVKARLDKRESVGFLDPQAKNYLDARLSIGLMILLKEYLKQTGAAEVWEGCVKYSEVFPNWEYGDKFKTLAQGDAPSDFSYKHGDLALTPEALASLLLMVGFDAAHQTRLISNEELAPKRDMIYAMDKHADLTSRLKTLVEDVREHRVLGALVGVAKKAFIGEKAQAPYDYVSHWVYLPKPARRDLDPWASVTWTWGEEWTLRALLTHEREYVPKLAITFS